MAVGKRGCVTHDDMVGERWCFLELLKFMVEEGMVNFKWVEREQLEGCIRGLPEEVQVMAEYLPVGGGEGESAAEGVRGLWVCKGFLSRFISGFCQGSCRVTTKTHVGLSSRIRLGFI